MSEHESRIRLIPAKLDQLFRTSGIRLRVSRTCQQPQNNAKHPSSHALKLSLQPRKRRSRIDTNSHESPRIRAKSTLFIREESCEFVEIRDLSSCPKTPDFLTPARRFLTIA